MGVLMKPDVGDIQLLFCDLQERFVAQSRTVAPQAIETAAVALARAAEILGWPLAFALVPGAGEQAAPLPGLRPYATAKNTFYRTTTDPFLAQDFVAALAGHGRKTVILAGVSAEVAVLQSGFGALSMGYRVYVPVDAVGSRFERTEATALRELERAGAVTTSVRSLLLRLTPDLSASPGREILAAIGSL